jgi:hypothetical protein
MFTCTNTILEPTEDILRSIYTPWLSVERWHDGCIATFSLSNIIQSKKLSKELSAKVTKLV